jgi:hypothetical protein
MFDQRSHDHVTDALLVINAWQRSAGNYSAGSQASRKVRTLPVAQVQPAISATGEYCWTNYMKCHLASALRRAAPRRSR